VWADQEFTWPVSILLVAVGLLVIGALTGTADMLVPASIVGGIGGILYFQNAGVLTWESWSFLWTLIPGFVGVGVFLAGLLKWNRKEMGDGLQSLLVSAVLFLVFGSLIGNVFGYVPFTSYLPILLIVLGIYLFVRAILKGARS
jgi:ABC-type branched-subunit amino acid transport system permease subunit